jgi:hypothetical protein
MFQENNLSFNINKMKELIVDYRRQQRENTPFHINGAAVERVKSFTFLGVYDSVVKKAQQRLGP